jgi:hypothetical protein
MKVNICLSLLNNSDAQASLTGDEMGNVDICTIRNSRDAKRLCTAAARKLRSLANRFEALSDEPEPFKEVTQDRVNRTKMK